MAYASSDTISHELLELASSKIDELTFNRINRIGLDNLTDFQKQLVEKATMFQAQYYEENGIESGVMSGFSVSGLSMSFSSNTAPAGVSQVAYLLLKQTGLMNRVV